MRPPQTAVAIAFGANLKHPVETIERAADLLRDRAVPGLRLAPFYRTTPVDCAPGTPPFINTVGSGTTSLAPLELLKTCKQIEAELGRPPEHGRNTPRQVDLDILLWGDAQLRLPGLTVPHPQMTDRLFVLAPLADIAPSWVVPGSGRTVSALTAELLASAGSTWGQRLPDRP